MKKKMRPGLGIVFVLLFDKSNELGSKEASLHLENVIKYGKSEPQVGLCIDYNNVNHLPLTRLARQSYEEDTINEIIYDNIKDEINPDSLQAFATIAYQCLKLDHEERPLMSDVVAALETAFRHQEGIDEHVYDGGTLVVTIHEGNNLKMRKPYVNLSIGYDIRRTTTWMKGHDPIWKETFKFTLEKPAKATLQLAVLSESKIDASLWKSQ
ncbi:hypothetical protein QVD17_21177 [Tagetes erecta]|uniref:C2 domain-containing protein n=1 Tax=Tagetes erecta TaxID=13708 RepID=A0AAD8KRE8_TARER|nr:hypothetical protein QVD17_21177 [Tagetes erecta]